MDLLNKGLQLVIPYVNGFDGISGQNTNRKMVGGTVIVKRVTGRERPRSNYRGRLGPSID